MKEYFPHDCDTREDEKIMNLMFKHSWYGYGLFWAIVEQLYKNDGYMQSQYERIAFVLQTQSDIIKSIIEDFDLFKFKDNYFYSPTVLKRIKTINEKSKKAKKSAEKRWNKDTYNYANAKRTQSERKANAKRTQSEGNAIKENKSKENKTNNVKSINTNEQNKQGEENNKNEQGNKKELKQGEVFKKPKYNEGKDVMFKNSSVAKYEDFKTFFKKEIDAGVDIYHYYETVKNWAESKGVKRKSWIAQAKNIMLSDRRQNKIKMVKNNGSNDEFLEFLKD